MAVWKRKPLAGLVHHSDRGVQYTAIPFGKRRLAEVGIVPSMGRTGTALWTTPWRRASHRHLEDRTPRASSALPQPGGSEECHLRVSIEGFYNRRRPHSALSYQSPADYEEAAMEGVAVA